MQQKTNILLVEDESILALSEKKQLEQLGYSVCAIVGSGEEAIQKVKELVPDMVLMDIHLKGNMDGIDAAHQIQNNSDIPIVYTTAYSDEETLQRAKTSQPFGYLLKPFDQKDLRIAIEICLYKHQMNIQLKKKEQWLSIVLQNIGDAVITTDKTGCVTYLNTIAEHLTGFQFETIKGKKFEEIFKLFDENTGNRIQYPPLDVLLKGSIDLLKNSTLLSTHNGRKIPIEKNAAPINDTKGNLIGQVIVFRDITERKQIEMKKQQIQQELFQTQKMEAIGKLIDGVVHDFNNLLTIIKGYAEQLIKKNIVTGLPTEDLEHINIAAEIASHLTQQVLLFSRKKPITKIKININKCIEILVEIMKRIIGENINIQSDMNPEISDIMANQVNIEQIVMNLVLNARDAMPDGGSIKIATHKAVFNQEDLRAYPEIKPGEFICLSVTDTGIGMDSNIMQQIFDPFFTNKSEGTGLGLSVVYGIVQNLSGFIHVSSHPDQGTTFKVYFPSISHQEENDCEREKGLQHLQGKGERILVVEDEQGVRDLIKKILTGNGYVVYDTRNVKETFGVFKKEHGNFNMILSDVVLPDGNGLRLIEDLRSKKPKLQVLLSSGYGNHKFQWQEINKKGIGFIQKPFSSIDLLQSVKKMISCESTRYPLNRSIEHLLKHKAYS